ncbi:hypothetical protein K505DRAFT_323367 [Melanomma pulvis-pyrius CBS 109.77]|uniref:Uncharacterized protein n=1 Tax=Melanomma pulvis-pyrius CBS 109.77 TaxID=1314802 RepID=A0A6A6XKF1_9PLEO|nr:hypothetical protein K505DRAFT_323367 [Melanomma pulvis-pyrius CBS 109.77]
MEELKTNRGTKATIISFLLSTNLFIGMFTVMYFGFVILFGIQLGKWDYTQEGRCYYFDGIAKASSSHPHVDKIYLGVTSAFMLVPIVVFILELLFVLGTIMQFPLYLYMAIQLRQSNERHLSEPEKEWGFGQVVAIVLLLAVGKAFAKAYIGLATPATLIRSRTNRNRSQSKSEYTARGDGSRRKCAASCDHYHIRTESWRNVSSS